MDSVAKWGFRIKLSIVITISTICLSLLISSPSGQEMTGTRDAIVGFLIFVFFVSLLLLPVFVYIDALAIRQSDQYNWEPQPWLWGLGVLIYGILLIPYLLLRKSRIGDLGGSLRGGIIQQLRKFSPVWNRSRSQMSNKIEFGEEDIYILKLKIFSVLYIMYFLISNSITLSESITSILHIIFFISYIGMVYYTWQDGKAVKIFGKWNPHYFLWTYATLVFLGVPALGYLLFRHQNQGDLGPPLRRILSQDYSYTGSGESQVQDSREIRNEDQEPKGVSNLYKEKLEEARVNLKEGTRLASEEEYIDARDAFETALTNYRSLTEEDGISESSIPSLRENIERAEQGIENCWLEPLTQRVDKAETHLENHQDDKAQQALEQVDSVLKNRSFEYVNTDGLEQRVKNRLYEIQQ